MDKENEKVKFDQYAEDIMESKMNPLESLRGPLEGWSKDTDPAIFSGDEWVDPENDYGNASIENKELEKGISPQSGTFMHPVHDVSYGKD